jgi:hypothetical protein
MLIVYILIAAHDLFAVAAVGGDPIARPPNTDPEVRPGWQTPISTQPVVDVLTRVIGAESAAIFQLALNSTAPQGFTLSTAQSLQNPSHHDGPTHSPHSGMRITVVVTASGLPELAYGCAYYLRTYAQMSFAWERTGGNQVSVDSLVGSTEYKHAACKLQHYLCERTDCHLRLSGWPESVV